LMLPLVFAAFVWPARRVWAMRAIELLVALILSKFAIVAVLALGGAALSQSTDSLTGSLAGIVLLLMGAFAPWALLRLIPLSELASGAISSLRTEGRPIGAVASAADAGARLAHERWGEDWATGVIAGMRRQAEQTPGPGRGDDPGEDPGPAGGDAPPVDGDAVPVDGGAARADDDAVPADDGSPPADDDAAPADDDADPADDGASPVSSVATRPAGSAPAVGTGAPTTGDDTSPAGTSDSTVGDGIALAGPSPDQGGPPGDQAAQRTADGLADPNAGIGPLLEAPNGGWRELYLGPDRGQPPAPLWPPDLSGGSAPEGGGGGGAGGGRQPHGSGPGSTSGGTADKHDPRPSVQETGRGPV
jgi:hypothetical protein